jgi:hypothetical protein
MNDPAIDDLRHPNLAAVEQLDRLPDRVDDRRTATVEIATVPPELVDDRYKPRVHRNRL